MCPSNSLIRQQSLTEFDYRSEKTKQNDMLVTFQEIFYMQVCSKQCSLLHKTNSLKIMHFHELENAFAFPGSTLSCDWKTVEKLQFHEEIQSTSVFQFRIKINLEQTQTFDQTLVSNLFSWSPQPHASRLLAKFSNQTLIKISGVIHCRWGWNILIILKEVNVVSVSEI